MNAPSKKKRIGMTLGDPAGIGPEIVLRLLNDLPGTSASPPLALYGNETVLRATAEACHLPWPLHLQRVTGLAEAGKIASECPVLVEKDEYDFSDLVPGKIQYKAGKAAYAWIRQAARDALSGEIAALVTCPVHKQSMRLAGMAHPGHTELLAGMAGAKHVAMMFVAPELTVTLATIHLPIKAVADALFTEELVEKLRLTHSACLNRLGRPPRIGVLALNPHAGEGGNFGNEEARFIHPAIEQAARLGLNVAGPLVPDAAWTPAQRGRFDAYLAMYHDQALIPFKMLAFDHGVNVTLGLPFPRTSVDHGTAFDIAWKGMADARSLKAAFQLAEELSNTVPQNQSGIPIPAVHRTGDSP